MLAKFENGNFLEVVINEEENEYEYFVYDEDGDEIDNGWSEYRDIEMYYPMNLIDYILHYCDGIDVDGKYEIIKEGRFVLETQGDNNEVRVYPTFELAQRVMKKEYEEILEDKAPCMDDFLDDDCAEIGDEEYFQSWVIYEEKNNLTKLEKAFHKIELQFDRIYTGVSQYAYELEDTSVITDHVTELRIMINELKEMI